MSTSFNQQLLELLNQLLRFVTWQEALARACAELLEGEWADEYIGKVLLPEEVHLWPSQKQGIAQALYVLSRQGSVLVADATGSGKTRLGAHLIRAIQDQIAGSGRLRRGRAVMVCPPTVKENWEAEARLIDTSIETVSHGKLSWASAGRHEDLTDSLRRGQILCVDEGHNFLNLAPIELRACCGTWRITSLCLLRRQSTEAWSIYFGLSICWVPTILSPRHWMLSSECLVFRTSIVR